MHNHIGTAVMTLASSALLGAGGATVLPEAGSSSAVGWLLITLSTLSSAVVAVKILFRRDPPLEKEFARAADLVLVRADITKIHEDIDKNRRYVGKTGDEQKAELRRVSDKLEPLVSRVASVEASASRVAAIEAKLDRVLAIHAAHNAHNVSTDT